MVWKLLCATLAAAGAVFALWALLGWCVLPVRHTAITIYRLSGDEPRLEQQVRAFVWSRGSGFTGGRLLLLGGAEAPRAKQLARRLAAHYGCVEYLEAHQLQERHEWNKNRK